MQALTVALDAAGSCDNPDGLAFAGKAADVKRCHAMRGAFQLLDFDDESIADVRTLLLRAAFSPAFLRPAEGRRFLGFLFTLQVARTTWHGCQLDVSGVAWCIVLTLGS